MTTSIPSVFAPKSIDPLAPVAAPAASTFDAFTPAASTPASPVSVPKPFQPQPAVTQPNTSTHFSDRHPGAHPSLAQGAPAYVPQSSHPVCGVIGPQMIITGDIQFEGELLVQGKVTGNIRSQDDAKGILRIDEKAEVVGDVDVPVVKVAGILKGNVSASELLHLQPSGSIEGPVKYNNIQLESGGTLSGSLSPDFKNARK